MQGSQEVKDKFWGRVNLEGAYPDFTDPLVSAPNTRCWDWTGTTNKSGYGSLYVPGHNTQYAHRVSYSWAKGDIPQGLQIDHMCRNRACVNPDHLRAVTAKENRLTSNAWSGRNARTTHCPKGHPYDEENTQIGPTGSRFCRACKREQYLSAHIPSGGVITSHGGSTYGYNMGCRCEACSSWMAEYRAARKNG